MRSSSLRATQTNHRGALSWSQTLDLPWCLELAWARSGSQMGHMYPHLSSQSHVHIVGLRSAMVGDFTLRNPLQDAFRTVPKEECAEWDEKGYEQTCYIASAVMQVRCDLRLG